jgi:hypothetical protein
MPDSWQTYLDSGSINAADTNLYQVLVEKYAASGTVTGTTVDVDVPPFRLAIGGAGETLLTRRRNDQLEFNIVATSSATVALVRALQGAAPRTYRMRLLINTDEKFVGYCLTGFVRSRLNEDGDQVLVVTAKTRLLSLDRLRYYDHDDVGTVGDTRSLSATATGILDTLGHGYSVAIRSDFEPTSPVGIVTPSVDVYADGSAFYTVGKDSKITSRSCGYVLDNIALLFGGGWAAWDGQWHLVNPHQATGGTDLTAEDWIAGSDEVDGREPYYSVRATYRHGLKAAGVVLNGDFELWGAVDTDQAENWTYGGGGTSGVEFVRKAGWSGYGLCIKTVEVADGTPEADYPQYADFVATQNVGNVPVTGQPVRITLRTSSRDLSIAKPQRIGSNAYHFYHLKHGTNYWIPGTGWVASGSLGPDEHKIRINQVFGSVAWYQETIDFTSGFPSTAALEIGLYGGVRTSAPFDTGGDLDLHAVWDDVQVDLLGGTDTGSGALAYVVYDTTVSDAEELAVETLLGDGPSIAAKGALVDSLGALVGDWKRAAAEVSTYTIARLAAMNIMATHRRGRRRIRLTLATTAPLLSPIEYYTIDSVDYWPVLYELTTEGQTLLLEELRDDGMPTDLTEETESRAGGVSDSDAAVVYTALYEVDGRVTAALEATRLTATSSAVSSGGAVTSIPITAIGGAAARVRVVSGDTVLVVALGTNAAHTLTASADCDGNDTAISVASYTPDTLIPAGSAVYVLARQHQDNALRGGGDIDKGALNVGTPSTPETTAGRARFKKAVNFGDPVTPATGDGDVAVTRDASIERALNVGAPASPSTTAGDIVAKNKIKSEGEVEIDGALNHDGTTAGFYGATPVTQPASADQAALGAVTQATITDNSGGAASTTIAAATNTDALTDSTGGSANTTLAAVGATNASDVSGAINDNFADIAAQLVKQRALNTVLVNAVASLAAELNKARTDETNNRTLTNQVRGDLVSLGLIKGSA